MIARSSALTLAGLRYTDEQGSASNRHCCDIGGAGFTRSTIACRSTRLSCRAFVPKIIFDLQLADLPVQKIDLRFIGGCLADAPPSNTLTAHRAVASSSCGSG